MITITSKGDFKRTAKYLMDLPKSVANASLSKYGEMGVEALREATPKDTGETADSWSYEILRTDTSIKIVWLNSNRKNGALIAVLLQYGHATRFGGYVEGIDYINPALKPVFDKILESVEKEVRNT